MPKETAKGFTLLSMQKFVIDKTDFFLPAIDIGKKMKLRPSGYTIKEIHDILDMCIYMKHGQHLPFKETVNKEFYCTVIFNYFPDMFDGIYGDSNKIKT